MDSFAELHRHVHPLMSEKLLGRGPKRVAIGSRDYALFRDGSGRPGALVDRCPHRMAPLSLGRVMSDGRLECPYHGWNFTVEGAGRSPTQPTLTKCDVKALRVERRYDYLWGVDPSSTAKFPLDTPDGFQFVGTFSQVFQAPIHVCLDNFAEDEHTPFVHTRLGWDRSQLHKVEFSAENFDDRTEVHYRAPQRPSRLLSLFDIQDGDYFHNDWVTRFDPLRFDYRISFASPAGERRPITSRTVIFMTPESSTTTRLDVFAFLRLESERFQRWSRALGWAALALGWLEVWDDRRFTKQLAHTPTSMEGMRLGKFDKPLIHNRKLLERLYYGRTSDTKLSVVE